MAARRACVDYYGCTPTWDKTSHRVTAKVRTAFAGKSNVTIEMSQLDQERVSVAVISDGIGLDAGWCGRCSRDVNEITNRMTAILSLEE